MFPEIWTVLLSIPDGVLKAIGAIVGGSVATGFYLWGRLRTLNLPADPAAPRVSLSESDRQLGFTLIATGTDLTRALNEHGEALRRRRTPRT